MARWHGSTHADRKPGNWQTTRRRILARDHGVCQIRLHCCTFQATEVDHVVPGDDHSDANLRAACSSCNQARNIAMRPTRPRMRRESEPHPGVS